MCEFIVSHMLVKHECLRPNRVLAPLVSHVYTDVCSHAKDRAVVKGYTSLVSMKAQYSLAACQLKTYLSLNTSTQSQSSVNNDTPLCHCLSFSLLIG